MVPPPFTQVWLETHDYDYDVISDTDLHLDPNVLDGYRVLFVVGHSEYWSFEAKQRCRPIPRTGRQRHRAVGKHRGFSRVPSNTDVYVIECRGRGTRRGPRSARPTGRCPALRHDVGDRGMSREWIPRPGGCSG